jgi:hypothetical protein
MHVLLEQKQSLLSLIVHRQFAADVVGCNRDPNTDTIVAVDTWNLNQGRGNVLDATQDVELFSGNFVNGRISCT